MFLFLLIILCIFLVDGFVTAMYCRRERKKDLLYGNLTSNRPQYTLEDIHSYSIPKKIIKDVFRAYRGWIRYKLIRLGKVPCHAYRNFMLRNIYLMKISKTAVLYGGFEIRAPWKIQIMDGAVIGDESKLDGRNGIFIGENVNLSTGVWIWTEQHDLNDPYFMSNNKGGPVFINNRAWVSSRTTILPNVILGEGCVIAAGAVVTKSTEAYSINGGVPAKRIGTRSNNLKYQFDGMHDAFW